MDILDADGVLLHRVARYVPDANDQMLVDLGLAHDGLVVVRVSSAGDRHDYLDEASSQPRALGVDLRAIADLATGRSTPVSVHPLSEALVREVMRDAAGSAAAVLPEQTPERLDRAKIVLADRLGLSTSELDAAPVTVVDAAGNRRTGNALGVVLAALSGYELAAAQDTSQVIDTLRAADGATALEMMLVGAASEDRLTLQAMSVQYPAVESALLAGLPAPAVALLSPAALGSFVTDWLVSATLLRLSPQQALGIESRQIESMSATQIVSLQVALGDVVLNTPPVRRSGDLPVLAACDEDSASDTAVSLGLDALTYETGVSRAEAAQTLLVTITAIPDFLTLWKADGSAVRSGEAMTVDDLKTLRFKTVADASGSGEIVWTVSDDGAEQAPHANRLTERLSLSVTPLDDAPLRVSTAPFEVRVDEDSANTIATGLNLHELTYTGGGGADESTQTLGIRITAIPDTVTLWKADGSEVLGGASLTPDELRGLVLRTRPDASGSGTLRWTVTDSGRSSTTRPDGHANSLQDSLEVTVSPINDAPVASGSTLVLRDLAARVLGLDDFGHADVDGDALASITLTAIEGRGTLQIEGTSGWTDVALDQVIERAEIVAGKLRYSPLVLTADDQRASFGFDLSDGQLRSAEAATVSVDLTALLALQASDAGLLVFGDASGTGSVAAGDDDVLTGSIGADVIFGDGFDGGGSGDGSGLDGYGHDVGAGRTALGRSALDTLRQDLGNTSSDKRVFTQVMGRGADRIDAGAGHDWVMGGHGDDTVRGAQGDDQLWGRGGGAFVVGSDRPVAPSDSDLFIWQAGDAGAAGSTDTVKDFQPWNGEDGDRLDITALLQGDVPTRQTLAEWISIRTGQTVNGVAASSVITIDLDGAGSGEVRQLIALEGLTLGTDPVMLSDQGVLVSMPPLHRTAPDAPTAVTITPMGGTVVADTINASTTHLELSASIVPGQATSGRAEFYIGDRRVGLHRVIGADEAWVSWRSSDGTPEAAELQALIGAGGVVSVKLFNGAGAAVSAAGNPTLIRDLQATDAPRVARVIDDAGAQRTDITASGGASDDLMPTLRIALPTGGVRAVAGDRVQLLIDGSPAGEPITLSEPQIVAGHVDLTPAADLASGAHTFSATVTRVCGNVSAPAGAFSLTLDTGAPTLASFGLPATGVAVDADIVLTFDEVVKAGSGHIVISDGTDTRTIAITDTSQVRIDGKVVTVNPSSDLWLSTQSSNHPASWALRNTVLDRRYAVTIEAGALQDSSGNPHAGVADATAHTFVTRSSQVQTLRDAGVASNRVDLIFLSEGFKASEIAAGTYLAQARKASDFLLTGSETLNPFSRFRSLLNVHVISVASVDSGVDLEDSAGNTLNAVNTALDGWRNARSLSVANAAKPGAIASAALEGTGIVGDIKQLLMNVAVSQASSAFEWGTAPLDMSGTTIVHEMGHSYANLEDEYAVEGRQTYTGAEPSAANLTKDRSGNKWAPWLGTWQDGVGVIGVYEGGQRFYTQGIYRPSRNSMMNGMSAPFDLIGREKLVLDFYTDTRPFDGQSSAHANHLLLAAQAIDPTLVDRVWRVDGADLPLQASWLDVAALGAGEHTITLSARDNSGWVRSAYADRVTQTLSWTVNVQAANVLGSGDDRHTATTNGWVRGGAGHDVLIGSANNDRLEGEDGDDDLQGGAGDDLLMGGAGTNLLDGGAGVNTVSYRDATTSVTVSLAASAAQFTGDLRVDTLRRIANLIGGPGNDYLSGDDRANDLQGGEGDDTLIGGLGHDILGGGAGNDRIEAGDGNNLVRGDDGDDTVIAGHGSNRILGGAGHDHITAGDGTNTLMGEDGDDTLIAGNGMNTLDGGDGDDDLRGGTGNDTFKAGPGNNRIDGGGGVDTVSYADVDADTPLRITLQTESAQHTGRSVDVLARIRNLIGGAGPDVLTGNAEDNTLQGGAGDDILKGGGGNDIYVGGSGRNTASFEDASEPVVATLLPVSPAPTIDVSTGKAIGTASGEGTDTLWQIDHLIGGSGNDTLTGDGFANVLTGGPGNDRLTGGDGADTFVMNAPGFFIDEVTDFTSGVDHIRLSPWLFMGLGGSMGGLLEPSRLSAMGLPMTPETRIVYDPFSGRLSHDADGSGMGSPTVAFAQLINRPFNLQAVDFQVL